MKYLLLLFTIFIPSAWAKIVIVNPSATTDYISNTLKLSVTENILADKTLSKNIRGYVMTQQYYTDTKQGLINKMKNNGYKNLDNDEQVYAWIEILDKECSGKLLSAAPTIPSLNNLLEKGC